MDLKQVFITNLRAIRRSRGISQMKLAELCDTATNYIGEIEIGRRFPSLPLIEKLSQALHTEAYRFFIIPAELAGQGAGKTDTEKIEQFDEILDTMSRLPETVRLSIIHRLSTPGP